MEEIERPYIASLENDRFLFFLIFVIRWSMRESIQQAADERLAAAEQVKKVDTKKQENKQ